MSSPMLGVHFQKFGTDPLDDWRVERLKLHFGQYRVGEWLEVVGFTYFNARMLYGIREGGYTLAVMTDFNDYRTMILTEDPRSVPNDLVSRVHMHFHTLIGNLDEYWQSHLSKFGAVCCELHHRPVLQSTSENLSS